MMENFLQLAKKRIESEGYRDVGYEIKIFDELLAVSGEYRLQLLIWEFEENKLGFVTARQFAGEMLLEEDPEFYWTAIHRLMVSNDDFDRDVAFYSVIESDNPRLDLIKPFLFDHHLRFEAIDYLKNIFPVDVKNVLIDLAESSDEKTRRLAREKLADIASF